jgi:hypothetical protein
VQSLSYSISLTAAVAREEDATDASVSILLARKPPAPAKMGRLNLPHASKGQSNQGSDIAI